MKKGTKKVTKFDDVFVNQNFQFWSSSLNKPIWARKTSNLTAVSEGNREHVFYPNDVVMATGSEVHGMPLCCVRGNPKLVLLQSDKYWDVMDKNEAELKVAMLQLKIGVSTYDTKVFLVRK